MKCISMNLAKTYVKDADLQFAVRELTQNYRDEGDFEVKISSQHIQFASAADPGIDQLLVMGVSSKQDDDTKAGSFGEGLKLAALICTRRRNTELVINSPKGKITFEFKKPAHFDIPVLHAKIDPTIKTDQFFTTITANGLPEIFKKVLIPEEHRGKTMIEKSGNENTRVYSHDIFVGEFQDIKSMYHWNLNSLKLNRDRSIPDIYTMKSHIRYEIEKVADKDLMRKLFQHPNTVEAEVIGKCTYLDRSTKDSLVAAFHEAHGELAVLEAKSSYQNERAKSKGFVPIRLPDVFGYAMEGLISKAEDKLSRWDDVTRCKEQYPEYLKDAANIMDMLDIPAEVIVFNDMSDGTEGMARFEGDLVQIWLSDKLMMPGMRQKRIDAVVHELGHVEGKADDETWEFENSLTKIAGKLAMKLLDRM